MRNVKSPRSQIVFIAFVCVIALTSSAGADRPSLGIGVGSVLHGGVGADGFSTAGRLAAGFFETRERQTSVRVELGWIRFPIQSYEVPSKPPSSNGAIRARSDTSDDNIDLVGVSMNLLWFNERSTALEPYFMFGAGGFRVDESASIGAMLFIGPGFGARWSRGRFSLGLEFALQIAVADYGSTLMAPVRLNANF